MVVHAPTLTPTIGLAQSLELRGGRWKSNVVRPSQVTLAWFSSRASRSGRKGGLYQLASWMTNDACHSCNCWVKDAKVWRLKDDELAVLDVGG